MKQGIFFSLEKNLAFRVILNLTASKKIRIIYLPFTNGYLNLHVCVRECKSSHEKIGGVASLTLFWHPLRFFLFQRINVGCKVHQACSPSSQLCTSISVNIMIKIDIFLFKEIWRQTELHNVIRSRKYVIFLPVEIMSCASGTWKSDISSE